MKTIKTYLFIVLAVVLCLNITSCGGSDDDDDNGGGKLSGYYIKSDYENDISEAIQDADPDGFLGGCIGWKFEGSDVAVKLSIKYYIGSKSGSIKTLNVGGKTISIVAVTDGKYTYAIEGSAIYITSGDIGTISNGELYINDYSWHWKKL